MEPICRLCLNGLTERLQKFNFSKEVMLKFILLDLDITVTESPVICSQCLETLQQCHDFKKLCLKTENFLNNFYHTEEKNQLDLKCIINNDKCKIKYENENICRFCLEIAFHKLDKLDEDIFLKDMVHKCLPEFNLHITEWPGICPVCMEKLQILFNFMMACEDNDEKVKKCVSANGTDSRGHVSLSDVLKFVDNMHQEDVKTTEGETELVKVELVKVEMETDVSVDVAAIGEVVNDETDDEFVEMEDDTARHEIATQEIAKDKKAESHTPVEIDKDTPDEMEKRPCNHCPLVGPLNARDLAQHMCSVHNYFRYAVYRCHCCDFSAFDHTALQVHKARASHIVLWCKKCDFFTYTKQQFTEHSQTHDDFCLKCTKCSKVFNKQLYLDGHILTHHPEMERVIKSEVFRCGACKFKTVHKSDWLPHRCQGNTRYYCDYCEFSTPFNIFLMKHIRVKHKYWCRLCAIKFCGTRDFNKHMKRHTTEEKEGC